MKRLLQRSANQKSIIIEGIEYGKEHLKIGVTFRGFEKYLRNKFPEADSSLFDNLFKELFLDDRQKNYGINYDAETKYFLKTEAYFKYFDWQELIETQKSARRANILAIFAITVSIISAIATIAAPFMSETTINESQLNALIKNVYQTKPVN